jgi:arginyl-tRNA synthetase
VVVEYSSPNTNKPLHLGHLRNNFLGYSAEILKSHQGHGLQSEPGERQASIYWNRCWAIALRRDNPTAPLKATTGWSHRLRCCSEHYREEVHGSKPACPRRRSAGLPLMQAQQMLQQWGGDTEVRQWRQMGAAQGAAEPQRDPTAIGVDFDKFYYRSGNYLLGRAGGRHEQRRACPIKRTALGVGQLQAEGPRLLLRGDGTSVYITQDLGTTELKYQVWLRQQYLRHRRRAELPHSGAAGHAQKLE